jgi:hypothetical protein
VNPMTLIAAAMAMSAPGDHAQLADTPADPPTPHYRNAHRRTRSPAESERRQAAAAAKRARRAARNLRLLSADDQRWLHDFARGQVRP